MPAKNPPPLTDPMMASRSGTCSVNWGSCDKSMKFCTQLGHAQEKFLAAGPLADSSYTFAMAAINFEEMAAIG